MATGFEVYANDGTLLINNNMIGWFCARSGIGQTQTTPTAAYGNTTSSIASIDVSGYTYALTAIRLHGDSYAAARFTNAYQSGNHVYTTNAPVGANFSWYVYDYAPRLPATNIGVEIYRDDGQRSFSSAYMPFKPIKDLQSGSIYTPGHELAITGPSPTGYGQVAADGLRYYVRNQNGSYTQVQEEDNPTHYGYTRDCKLWGGKVVGPDAAYLTPVSFDDVTSLPQPLPFNTINWSVNAPVLVVDVSNIPVPGNFF